MPLFEKKPYSSESDDDGILAVIIGYLRELPSLFRALYSCYILFLHLIEFQFFWTYMKINCTFCMLLNVQELTFRFEDFHRGVLLHVR